MDIPTQRLSADQAIAIYSHTFGGCSPILTTLARIPPPPGDERFVEELGYKRSCRTASQFLRDMADSMDPEGPLTHQLHMVELTDLYAIMAAHGLNLNQVIAVVEKHVGEAAFRELRQENAGECKGV